MDQSDEEFLRDILMTIGVDNFVKIVDILERRILAITKGGEHGDNTG